MFSLAEYGSRNRASELEDRGWRAEYSQAHSTPASAAHDHQQHEVDQKRAATSILQMPKQVAPAHAVLTILTRSLLFDVVVWVEQIIRGAHPSLVKVDVVVGAEEHGVPVHRACLHHFLNEWYPFSKVASVQRKPSSSSAPNFLGPSLSGKWRRKISRLCVQASSSLFIDITKLHCGSRILYAVLRLLGSSKAVQS